MRTKAISAVAVNRPHVSTSAGLLLLIAAAFAQSAMLQHSSSATDGKDLLLTTCEPISCAAK